MNTAADLFVEAWKAGVELSINGDKLHFEARSKPSDELFEKLKAHKPELMHFLSFWIDTPYGQAKFWGFVGADRCGVVLRNQPDRVTFIKCKELTVKPRVGWTERQRPAAYRQPAPANLLRQLRH